MEAKHPNDMTEDEIKEWEKHPEWAHWVNLRPRGQQATRALLIPPTGGPAFFLGIIFIVIGLLVSLFSVLIGNIGLAVIGVGLFVGLFGIYQAIHHLLWHFEQYGKIRLSQLEDD